MMTRRDLLKYLSLQGVLMTSGLGLGFDALAQIAAGTSPKASGTVPAGGAGPGAVTPPTVTRAAGRRPVLIFIIQRGAMDGLSLLAPIGDPHYAELRPNIKLTDKGDHPAKNLDGFFFLHPEAAPLEKYWQDKTLAMVHQCGSNDESRSHFDAQDFLETGTPGLRATPDGFLNRAMMQLEPQNQSGLHAVALQASMPRSLQGAYPAISMLSTNDFNLKDSSVVNSAKGFEDMYEQAADKVFRQAGSDTFSNLKAVGQLRDANRGAKDDYPKSQLGQHLKNIASLIKADLGLRIAATEIGAWDTHVNQGANQGQLGNRIKELSEAIDAFIKDLGPSYQDVVIVTQTEFGRTVRENGTRGTDHGHGSVMMTLGGQVRGGLIHAQWKNLKDENLFEGRDLPVTTDARHVWCEILSKHLALNDHARVFPGFRSDARNWLGVLRS